MMDWDLKMPVSWDLLAELEHDDAVRPAVSAATEPAVAGAAAASRIAFAARAECSVDLKLGGLGELGAAHAMKEQASSAAAAVVVPSASPLMKRHPRSGPGGGPSSCAVDGCEADLGRCRDYHRRHKVCEAHSKTPVVVVAGRHMRFCQQCSRFHLLAEFDEAKRSCRKRLDGHNRRRRKPQPAYIMNSGNFMTSQQGLFSGAGTRFSPFIAPRPEPSWSGVIKSEASSYYRHQVLSSRPHFAGLTSTHSKAGRRFPFLQLQDGGDTVSFSTGVAATVVCQPTLLKTPESSSSSSSKIFFPDGLTPAVMDSDRALSLLSSPANSSSVDVIVQPTSEHVPMALVPSLQQLGSSPVSWFGPCSQSQQASTTSGGGVVSAADQLACCCPCSTARSEQQLLSTVDLVPSSVGHEMNNCYDDGIFHVGGEGSSDGTSTPSLPFSWQ